MTDTPFPKSAANRAIALIKGEHRTLARMLGAIHMLVARYQHAGYEQNFDLFDAMLRYIENVPNKLHHPKEDKVLFPPFMRFAASDKQLVAELEHDHARGESRLGSMRRAYDAVRAGVTNGPAVLSAATQEFVGFYMNHMRREELQLLPLAVARFTNEEWQRVESAFGDNTDPLFGAELADDYRLLYQCIIELAPATLKSYLEGAVIT